MRGSREEAKLQSREALLEAGAELFGRDGLDGPSLDAICARAGYTRGAFYVHFRDRDDLLEAVMERVGAQFLDGLFAAAGEGGLGDTLATTVERFIAAMASGAYPLTRKGGVRPHQLLQACARSPRIRARYVALIARSVELLGEVLRAGQAGGSVRADVGAAEISALLLATVIGAQTMLELKVPLDPAASAAAVLRLLAPEKQKRRR